MPGDAEAEEQIWRNLDGLFRDGGFALWPNVFGCTLKTPDGATASPSGFGYAIPSRTDPNLIGTVGRLRRFDYRVGSFIPLFYRCLMFMERIHSRELRVPEMDMTLSSALSSLGAKGTNI